MQQTLNKTQTFFKTIATHIVKTIVATILVAVVGGIGTSFVFYYKANNAIDNLMNNDKKQDYSIKKVTETLEQINEKIGGTNVNNAVSETKIKGIEQQISQVQEQQKIMQETQMDMLKILGELNRKK